MGIFTKKPTYEDAVLFVKHLTEAEYQKFIKVVRTYRGAEKSVQAVLGGKLSDYKLEYEEVGDPKLQNKIDARAKEKLMETLSKDHAEGKHDGR